MAFRNKPHYPLSPATPEVRDELTATDSGCFIRLRKIGFRPLASVDDMSLEKMLKAGVPMEKVSTIIRSNVPSASQLLEKSEPKDELKHTLSEE